MLHHISFDLAFKKNPYPGKIVVIEGIDGAGKTTQAKALVKKLNKEGYVAAYTKEPTDDVVGQFIREKVLSGSVKMNPLALQYLFNADRVMHMEKIEKLLEKGMIIVMDRYFWSAVAYAMADMQAIGDWTLTAFSILSFYHQFLMPDFTFFIQISPEVAWERVGGRSQQKEIYETKEKIVKTEEAYTFLQEKFPSTFTRIHGEQSPEEITEEIFDKVVGSL